MNLLVVDDEAMTRMALRDLLKRDGWKLFEAENGADALTLLKGNNIDLVLCDVYMPVMDGLKFLKAMRAVPEYAKIPLLFMSGHDDDLTRLAIQSSGNAGFWKKSSPTTELKQWLHFLMIPADKRKGRSPFEKSFLY